MSINATNELVDSPPLSFHLPTVLAGRVPKAGDSRKRVRTRRQLLAATAFELEESGYDGLTIDRIVERAGMARGTFYIYFANRSDAATAVKKAFDALMRQLRPHAGPGLTAAQTIHRMNRFYIACYARNGRIIAGYEALMRERQDLAHTRDFVNHRWAGVVLRDFCKRRGQPLALRQDPKALLAIRAVIAMADEILRETYAYQSPILAEIAKDQEDLAQVMTFLWHRAIFGEDPEGFGEILPRGNGAQAAPSA